MKRCPKCNEIKPLSEYYRWTSRDGKVKYQSWCKSCQNSRQSIRASHYNGESACDTCKFLEPCRKIVFGKITREIVTNGQSVTIYIDPYCFADSPMHGEFRRAYRNVPTRLASNV